MGEGGAGAGASSLGLALTALRWAIAIALSGRATLVAVRALRQPAMPAKRRAVYVLVAVATILACGVVAIHGPFGRTSAVPHP